MRYMATIYISDILEDVACTIEVQEWEEMYGPPEAALQKTYVWRGLGIDNPAGWLVAALRGVCAEMSRPATSDRMAGPPVGGSYTISETGDGRI